MQFVRGIDLIRNMITDRTPVEGTRAVRPGNLEQWAYASVDLGLFSSVTLTPTPLSLDELASGGW